MKLLLLALLPLAFAWDDQWCGYSRYGDAGRELPPYDAYIVGGWAARIHEFPWQVSLRYADGLHFCGGSIINSKYILTAAHCTFGETPNSMEVMIAEHMRLGNDTENVSKFLAPIASIIRHEDYNPLTYQNDISLIELESELDFSSADMAYLPVCPPAPDANGDTLEGQPGTVSGWGTTSSGNAVLPNELRYTNLGITTNEICAGCLTMPDDGIYQDMICAGNCGPNNGRDTCQGDSGGPLAWRNTATGRFELIGITSWGYSCAGRSPGVYAMVSYFLDWIDGIITPP